MRNRTGKEGGEKENRAMYSYVYKNAMQKYPILITESKIRRPFSFYGLSVFSTMTIYYFLPFIGKAIMQMRTISGEPIILTSTLNNFHGV